MSIRSTETGSIGSARFHSKKASEIPPSVSTKPPHVLISGAGIGGLMLAIILERTNISYEIYEKAREVRRVGSTVRTKDAKLEGVLAMENTKEITGYEYAVCGRPQLEGVMIRLSDGSTAHGDILVGADGAYSGVRQHLYKELEKLGKLPKSDTKPLTKGFICMVGLTSPMDPENYPVLKDDVCHADAMISSTDSFTWNILTLPGNIMSWGTVFQLNSSTYAYEHFRNSDWGPEANEPLIKEVSEFKTPYGTLGELINATPRHTISRVFLEDKFFETWTYSRTVLIGDACHKFLPSSGLGAVNAIQDAVVLANCIYEMRMTSYDSVQKALENYRDQRFDGAKTQHESSKFTGRVIYGHVS
ncbi:hypothetical protein BGZ46_003137 [Entomortierella lignicola]|nr:hypothetical protein BGZ46_003137 [Entomortierella lignicola]